MPKILRTRIVNLTYNDNRHIPDMTQDMYGKNTLITLANGGGKSVMVQAFLQPMIPNSKPGERAVIEWFKKKNTPTYIMHEWLLNENGGRVLTGIGIKKNTNTETDSLKMVAFISEYSEPGPYDLNSIVLTEKDGSTTRMIDFESVIQSLSDAEKNPKNKVWVYRVNNYPDKKDHEEKLREYGIDRNEWKSVIEKMNADEGGLSKTFVDNNKGKTSKKLLDGWIIPNIEENLNIETDRIPNLRQSIKDVARSIVKNETLIEEKKCYEAFKPKVETLLNNVNKYDDINSSIEETSLEIGAFYSYLKEKLKENEDEKDGIIYELDRIESQLTEIDYEILSFEFYESQKERDRLEGLLFEIRANTDRINEEIVNLERMKSILECARLNSEINSLSLKIKKNKIALEKETKDNEQIERELRDVNYTLRIKYENMIEEKKTKLAHLEKEIEEAKINMVQKVANLNSAEGDMKKLNDLRNEYDGRIKVFESKEDDILKKFPDFNLGRNVMGEYDKTQVKAYMDSLNERLAEICHTIDKLNQSMEKNKEKILSAEKEREDVRIKLEEEKAEEVRRKIELETIETGKEKVLDVFARRDMKSFGLSDRYGALEKLMYKEREYQRLIDISKINISNKENQLNMYETGKNVSMPEGLEEELGSHGINCHFGFEWLKNYSASEDEKSKLLSNNPFIPYSIILTKRDMDALKDVDLKVFTSTSIPIIERESLESSFGLARRNSVYVLNGMNFLMNFNDKLLNEEGMILIRETLNKAIEREREEVESLEKRKVALSSDIRTIESFAHTDSDIESYELELEKVRTSIHKHQKDIGTLSSNISEFAADSEELRDLIVEANRDKENLTSQIKAISDFLKGYEAFLVDLARLGEAKNNTVALQKRIDSIKAEIENARMAKDVLTLDKKDVLNELNVSKKDQQSFLGYDRGNVVDGDIDELLVVSKSLESKRSGSVDSIQENINDFTEEKNKLMAELEGKNIENVDYAEIVYTKEAYDDVLDKIKETSMMLNDAAREEGGYQADLKTEEGRLRKKEKEIFEKHSGKPPKDIGSIMGLDFRSRRASCEKERDEYNDLLGGVDEDIRKLEKIVSSMDEYKDFPAGSIEKSLGVGELDEHKSELLRKYKGLRLKEREARDRLNDEYINLENQFAEKDSLYGDFFKKYLIGDKKYRYQDAALIAEQMLSALERKIAQMQVVLDQIDRRKDEIVRNAEDHILGIYEELSKIDSNSAIEMFGRRKKMLELSVPKKEDLMTEFFGAYMRRLMQDSVSIIKESGKREDELDIYLRRSVDTIPLFNKLVGDDSVKVYVMKVEQNKVKRISWEEAMRSNSGGEHFVSTFIVTATLMNYTSKNTGNNGKVLIMDNPFGKVTSEHLLTPIFMVAEKYDTQLICLSDITLSDVVGKFDVINSMKVDTSSNGYEFISLDPMVQFEDEEFLSLAVFNRNKKNQSTLSEQISLI